MALREIDGEKGWKGKWEQWVINPGCWCGTVLLGLWLEWGQLVTAPAGRTQDRQQGRDKAQAKN